MPKYLENPSLLTKERLKADLRTHGVTLPRGEQRKDAYVQLYLEHLTSRNKGSSSGSGDFSSDEEDNHISPVKPIQRSRSKPIIRKPVKGLPYDVHALSDGDLARQLKGYGQVVGPITETTRPLYQKKLIKLLMEEAKNPVSAQKPVDKPRPWEYSDTEEEEAGAVNAKGETEDTKPMIEYEKDDDEVDQIDASPEPKVEIPPPRSKRGSPQLPPKVESTPRTTPQVVKRETIIQETYMETKKRATVTNRPAETSPETTIKKKIAPPVSSPKTESISEWEWKAVLIILAIITIILFVYYFMEGNPDKPKISSENQRQ